MNAVMNTAAGAGITVGTIWQAKHDARIRVSVLLPSVEIRLSGRVKVPGILYLRQDQTEPPTVRRLTEFVATFTQCQNPQSAIASRN